jgi:hypothetical protein
MLAGDGSLANISARSCPLHRSPPISFKPFQNASSRLTLVLWPATTIEPDYRWL